MKLDGRCNYGNSTGLVNEVDCEISVGSGLLQARAYVEGKFPALGREYYRYQGVTPGLGTKFTAYRLSGPRLFGPCTGIFQRQGYSRRKAKRTYRTRYAFKLKGMERISNAFQWNLVTIYDGSLARK